MALGPAQPLTEMSTRKGGRSLRQTTSYFCDLWFSIDIRDDDDDDDDV
jgi:hypothetical protein